MTPWPKVDFHLHATRYRLSGARPEMTVVNIVRRCEALGYIHVGIVEHLDSDPKHPPSCLQSLVAEFRTLASPLHLYVGAELDIEGERLSVPDAAEIKRELGLDYCLGSVHSAPEGLTNLQAFMADHHRRTMILVHECDEVDVIAHPWATGHSLVRKGVLDQWRFSAIPEAYLREFVEGLAERGKAMEINSKAQADFADPAYLRFLEMLRKAGVPIAVGSDAHSMERVGNTAAIEAFLAEVNWPLELLWIPARNSHRGAAPTS